MKLDKVLLFLSLRTVWTLAYAFFITPIINLAQPFRGPEEMVLRPATTGGLLRHLLLRPTATAMPCRGYRKQGIGRDRVGRNVTGLNFCAAVAHGVCQVTHAVQPSTLFNLPHLQET